MVVWGEGWVEEIVWNGQVHPAIFKMDNKQGPIVERRELCLMSCGSLGGRGVWGRMDTCKCMAQSICYST